MVKDLTVQVLCCGPISYLVVQFLVNEYVDVKLFNVESVIIIKNID